MAAIPKPSKLMMDGFVKLKGKQATGQLLRYDENDAPGDAPVAACALGCIIVGLGLEEQYRNTNNEQISAPLKKQLFDDVRAYLPAELFENGNKCDCDDCKVENLREVTDIIVQLNDEEDWSIPQISNWLHEKLGL